MAKEKRSFLTKLKGAFTIRTRVDVLFVIYGIALGAAERGFNYIEQYGGYSGLVLAAACLIVPVLAGAKLIESVSPPPSDQEPAKPVLTEQNESKRSPMRKSKRTVPAANFCSTVEANVDNSEMSDASFREFIRNSLPIVQYQTVAEIRTAQQG